MTRRAKMADDEGAAPIDPLTEEALAWLVKDELATKLEVETAWASQERIVATILCDASLVMSGLKGRPEGKGYGEPARRATSDVNVSRALRDVPVELEHDGYDRVRQCLVRLWPRAGAKLRRGKPPTGAEQGGMDAGNQGMVNGERLADQHRLAQRLNLNVSAASFTFDLRKQFARLRERLPVV